MRREGGIGVYHTSHTLRAAHCDTGRSCGSCGVHSKEQLEEAYHSLQAATGRTRISRKEIHTESLRLNGVIGPGRNTSGTCAMESAFKCMFIPRRFSPDYYESHESKPEKRKRLHQSIIRALQCQ